MWGNKAYPVGKIVQDNGLESLREALGDLLWGKAPLPDRFDAFARRIKGMGPASVTELLAFIHPEECGLWNDKARKALVILGLDTVFPKVKKYHLTGAEYMAFNDLLKAIRDELTGQGLAGLDLIGVDFFLFHVWETQGHLPPVKPPPRPVNYDFDHDEMVDQLVSIGRWMGFEAEKEKWIAKGAKVDVVWQARIANLGIVTYVFEVQKAGSVDSLILNLQKARKNPSVQKVVVVANTKNLRQVQEEVSDLSQEFAGAVVYLEARDLERAAEHLQAFSEIIGRLELVPRGF